MNPSTFVRTEALSLQNSIKLTSRYHTLVALLALFALSPAARAQDGGYARFNTAEGQSALNVSIYSALATGTNNTAIGYNALLGTFDGSYNTGSGSLALYHNSGGSSNTAGGYQALYSNTSGYANTATGAQAMVFNTTGNNNTATGIDALYSNINGHDNTGSGVNVLLSNSSGYFNTANGGYALYSNTTGHDNTAEGFQSLFHSTGSFNIALGSNAGYNLTTGSNNIVIGAGVLGAAGDANKIRIGKSTHTATYIGGVYNKTVASGTGVAVRVDSTGKLGTVLSSARYKDAIKPMDKASEAIHRLEPVSFRYKQELDPDGVTQFGLIAEQVEKVNPDLVVHDEDGKVSTVRYEAVNAMLLNEFLKEHRNVAEQQTKVAEQESTIAELKTTVAQQQKQIEALTATVRKVSDRVELSEPAPQIAANEN
jgi:uncharacterized coiled-coil protein SlyX